MQTWSVQDAKARFSEFLDLCVQTGPQVEMRLGVQTAVLVPYDEWMRLQASAQPTLKDLLLAADAPTDIDLPVRGVRRNTSGTNNAIIY